MARLRWLTGQIELSTANCRKVMKACIQSVDMSRSDLRWEGDNVRSTIGTADDVTGVAL